MYKKEHGWTKKTFPLHATMSALKMLFTETFKCVLPQKLVYSTQMFPVPLFSSLLNLQSHCKINVTQVVSL